MRTDAAACTQEERVLRLVAMKIILRSMSSDARMLEQRNAQRSVAGMVWCGVVVRRRRKWL
jgi:hypothetical protein